MSQKEAFIQIPPNIDGIEEASEKVLSQGDPIQEAAHSDISEICKKLSIRKEYFEQLEKRPNESLNIKRELAEKYENNPDRTGYIHYVIYDWNKKKKES